MVHEFSAGHRQEWAVVAFDELNVADDESVIKCKGTEGLETVTRVSAEVDSNFGELHRCALCVKQRCVNRRDLTSGVRSDECPMLRSDLKVILPTRSKPRLQ